jgi:hypothetical protein
VVRGSWFVVRGSWFVVRVRVRVRGYFRGSSRMSTGPPNEGQVPRRRWFPPYTSEEIGHCIRYLAKGKNMQLYFSRSPGCIPYREELARYMRKLGYDREASAVATRLRSCRSMYKQMKESYFATESAAEAELNNPARAVEIREMWDLFFAWDKLESMLSDTDDLSVLSKGQSIVNCVVPQAGVAVPRVHAEPTASLCPAPTATVYSASRLPVPTATVCSAPPHPAPTATLSPAPPRPTTLPPIQPMLSLSKPNTPTSTTNSFSSCSTTSSTNLSTCSTPESTIKLLNEILSVQQDCYEQQKKSDMANCDFQAHLLYLSERLLEAQLERVNLERAIYEHRFKDSGVAINMIPGLPEMN